MIRVNLAVTITVDGAAAADVADDLAHRCRRRRP